MHENKLISIIIPLKRDVGYLKPCVEACLAQKEVALEIIVLPDELLGWNDSRIIVEVTGAVSPARKRNRGAQLSKGEILAFIDDDTRPQPGWLEAALRHFSDPKIAAVGGPSITSSNDPYWAQVSGAAYESWMMSGAERRRYIPKQECDVEDFPSCNLLVRRSAFEEIGGFGTDFWPGEDTEFCLALIKKGYRIRYEPKALIEHHRRASLEGHFKQLANYGLHRGYFAKRYPETSLRFQYFLPSILVIVGLAMLIFSFQGNQTACFLLSTLTLFYFFLTGLSLVKKSPRLIFGAIYVILLSHIVYGISFIRGLCSSRLPEEK